MPIQTPVSRSSRTDRPQRFLTLGYLLAACTLPALSYAADNPGAHEHGQARLQIAVEDTSIDLMLTSPAYNLAGFEHEARTDQEKKQLADIEQWLKSNPLVNSADAGCRVIATAVELGGEDSGESHGHHGDHHDEHHGEDHHDHDEHHKEATHREYDVSQQLECDGAGERLTLTSELMEEFGNLEELAVEWVSPIGQGSARLTPSNRAFTINR